jgi:hypothetical protein
LEDARHCQEHLHRWGVGNQVVFDAAKENTAIFSHREPHGNSITLLGVEFDPRLAMNKAIHECVLEVGWKKRSLLRTQRFHTDADLVGLWKAHILSYIEYRTAAWYHACESALAPLDRCLSSFLRSIGVGEIGALLQFNLAPLQAGRDMAMLAVIHRAVLRQGPQIFHEYVQLSSRETRTSSRAQRRHSRHLVEYRDSGSKLEIMRRSLFGLVSVYNLLPNLIVQCNSVQSFQASLQDFMKSNVARFGADLFRMYSPRGDFACHVLRSL